MLLIPIGHDRQVTRQFPLITISLITFNVIIFILTATIGGQQEARKDYALEALVKFMDEYPGVEITPEAHDRLYRVAEVEIAGIKKYLASERQKQRGKAAAVNKNLLREASVIEQLKKRTCEDFVAAYDEFWGYQYGLTPAYQKYSWLNYFTSMFLHGGFMHILGNMLFLFLAGIAMEDAWGKTFYLGFYLLAGFVAAATHIYTAPDSKIYLVGASGAIAGLMGAFMVRYFRTRIKLFYFVIVRAGTFKAPAFVMLPLWIALELKDTFTSNTSESGGVAFWAHIGGFFFGAVISALVYYSGFEKLLAPKSSQKAVSFGTGNAVIEAKSHLRDGEPDEALRKLKQRLEAVPMDIEACTTLAIAYHQLQQRGAEIATSHRLIHLCLQQKKFNEALNAYSVMLDSYQPTETLHRLPPKDWLSLCDFILSKGLLKEAAGEYEKIARAYPGENFTAQVFVSAASLRSQLNEYEYARNLLQLAYDQAGSNPALLMKITADLGQLENVLRSKT